MLLNEFEKRNHTEKLDLMLKMTQNDCLDYLRIYKDQFSAHSHSTCTLMESACCFCCQLCNIMNCKYDCNLKSLCHMRLRIFHLSESGIELSSIHRAYSTRS